MLKSKRAFYGLFLLILLGSSTQAKQVISPSQKTGFEFSDSIFRVATNTPDYLVVKKSDWNQLKLILSDSLKKQQEFIDSEKQSIQTLLDSLKQQTQINQPENRIENDSHEAGLGFQINPLAVTIPSVALFIYGIVITLLFFNQKKEQKSQVERLKNLEIEINNYKKASIDRERKLMRELIDTRNQLEEEKEKQNSDSQ
jgi:hypothetical protein